VERSMGVLLEDTEGLLRPEIWRMYRCETGGIM